MTKIYTFLLALIISANCFAQWTQTNGPYGGTIKCFATSGNNTFAGTQNGGVFLSTNNGLSWTAVNTGLTTKDINSIAISGNNIFAATNGGGIFLSTNNGVSWSAVNGLTNPSGFYVYSIAISGINIFAGTNYGVFLSTNNGTSWTAVNMGLTIVEVKSIAISGNNIFAASNSGGISLSTNNGTSWTTVNTGLTNTSVFSIDINGSNIFAGTLGGVFLSTNNGTSWTAVNTGLTNTSVFSIDINGSNIFAGTGEGVFLSTNNGTSWTAYNTGLPISTNVNSLAINGNNIFAATNRGIYLSNNNAANWLVSNTGLTATFVSSMASFGNNIFASTFGNGIFLSSNSGQTWDEVNNGITNLDIQKVVTNGSNLYALGRDGNDYVFLSTNNGVSWSSISNGLPANDVSSIAVNGNNIFVGIYAHGVYMSSNNGSTWAAVNTGLTSLNVSNLLYSGNNLFSATDSGMFISSNNGTSWSSINNGLTNFINLGLIANGNDIYIGGAGIFKSTNNGTNWTYLNNPIFSQSATYALASDGSNIYASIYANGDDSTKVYFSSDNGINWINIGSPQVFTKSLHVTNNKLYSGGVGVWKRDVNTILNPCAYTATTNPSTSITSCAGSSTTITANTTASNPTYQWFSNGIALGGETQATLTTSVAGNYSVAVYSGNCVVTSNAVQVSFNNTAPTPPTITQTGVVSGCTPSSATLDASTGFSNYLWSNGATTQSITVNTSGNYTVTGFNSAGCNATSLTTVINNSYLAAPDICLVTVDTIINKNLIVWEKTNYIAAEVDSFVIFKESILAGVYNRIGAQPYAALSEFTDAGSNALARADRYKIAVMDTCGNLTLPSSFYKTMHLQISPGTDLQRNLSWTHAEGITDNYYHRINRKNQGVWTTIDSVQSNINTYTDLNVPNINVLYFVDIVLSQPCVSSLVQLQNASQIQTQRVRSTSNTGGNINILNLGNSTIERSKFEVNLKLFPNPNNGNFVLQNADGSTIEKGQVEIFDLAGRKVIETMVQSNGIIEMNEVSNGLYYVKYSNAKSSKTLKMMVQKGE